MVSMLAAFTTINEHLAEDFLRNTATITIKDIRRENRNMFKKLICLAMALLCVCAMMTSALALTGTVNGPLRLRKSTSSTATIIGWLKDGDTVTITNAAPATGWYAVTGTAYQRNDYTGWSKVMSGYVMSKYIY